MNRIGKLSLFCLLALGIALAPDPARAEEFIVSDIRVEGLQRISAGTVFAAIPVAVGDVANEPLIRDSARALFATGNFDDIRMGRDGNVLVIMVEERPSISEITIEGNKAIETEALLEGLKGAGLAEGQVFRRSTLEAMQLELQRQYVQQGRYDAAIGTDVIPEPRNRVAVAIDVNEGSVAKIKHINIVGNSVFSDQELEELFELKDTHWLSWMTGDDKYSREKLGGDMETLTSHYMDRGYLQFRIDSTQVSVSPEKDAVYITANIFEGEVFKISSVDLSGDLVLPEDDLGRLLLVQVGDIYSQALVTSTEEFLTRRLGNEGYNFAKVTGIPEIDKENSSVAMKFFIDPGKRVYVRRISFHGNTRTIDEVLRREMRQMEGAPASAQAIEASRVRLERLGFFKDAAVETPDVPGHDDLIDVDFTVEEQSSGSISASFGYAQVSGLLLGLNLQQSNFQGAGKSLALGVNSSKYQDLYSFSYTDPYYTEDGVSRGLSIYHRATDLDEINVARYSTNTSGASMSFGYPISETQRLGLSLGLSNTDITVGAQAVCEIRTCLRSSDTVKYWFDSTRGSDGTYTVGTTPIPRMDRMPEFVSEEGFIDLNGDEYLNWTITGSWLQSSLNRGIFATRGTANSLSVEVSGPGSDLEFFKVVYRGEYYHPLTFSHAWALKLRTEMGYGEGFGDTSELPFYEHFFAGGFGSVRGYKTNTLGPRTTPSSYSYELACPAVTGDDGTVTRPTTCDISDAGYVARDGVVSGDPGTIATRLTDPFGGNVLIEGSVELIFPLPFIKDQRQIRSVMFWDIGNVFNTNCRLTQERLGCYDVDPGELRQSVGVGISWLTGLGPLTFSWARPLNNDDFDEDESFQFSVGRTF